MLRKSTTYQIAEKAVVELGVLGGEGDVPQPVLQAGLEDDAGEGVLRLPRQLPGGVDRVLDDLEGGEPARVAHQGGLPQPRLDVAGGHPGAPLGRVDAQRQQGEAGRRRRDLVPVRQEGLHPRAEDGAGGLKKRITFSVVS